MVTYASKEFDPMEQWELADKLSWTLMANASWQEYVEGLDEQQAI